MSHHCFIWRRLISTLGFVVVIAVGGQTVATDYTYVVDSANTGNWADGAKWTDVPDTNTYPLLPGDKALINAPIRSGAGTGNYTLAIAGNNITVGELTVNNASFANNYNVNMTTTTGQLTFQMSTLDPTIPAKYTETAGTSMTGSTRYTYNPVINVLSDWIIDDDNVVNLNTGTTFASIINGAAARTITKDGVGSIQFSANLSLLSGEGFNGKYDILEGGIRLIGTSATAKATGITVHSGGQLQLADNNGNVIPIWTLASGVLNLNGAGKTVVPNITTADGALRIGITAGRSTTFTNDVVLQTDSVVSVAATNTTGTLSGVVSGPGGLTKHGNGTLILNNASDAYGGDTHVLSGPGTLITDTPSILSVTNPIFAAGKDVYLASARAFLDLNFTGTDPIRSLYIDNIPQRAGTWGPGGTYSSPLITGTGSLTVTSPISPGDFDNNGVVDAGDYVRWRKSFGTTDTLSNNGSEAGTSAGIVDNVDYATWRFYFGQTYPGSGTGSELGAAKVPEPGTGLLALISMIGLLLVGRKR